MGCHRCTGMVDGHRHNQAITWSCDRCDYTLTVLPDSPDAG